MWFCQRWQNRQEAFQKVHQVTVFLKNCQNYWFWQFLPPKLAKTNRFLQKYKKRCYHARGFFAGSWFLLSNWFKFAVKKLPIKRILAYEDDANYGYLHSIYKEIFEAKKEPYPLWE